VAVQLGYQNVQRYPEGFPQWQELGHPTERNPLPAEASAAPAGRGPLTGWAMLWTLLGVFGGGVALNLTPCVYPLIPITVSFFGGRSGQGRGRLLVHGLCYLLGLATTNSILGVAAALTGSLMGSMLQNPFVLIGVALALVAFATSMFGFWELRLPSGLTSFASRSYAGYFGTLFMGLTLGIIAAPCIGPFVLGLLTWVASSGSPALGFAVFFTLSLGLGLPLFFLAMFSGQLEKLPRSGEWMIWVRKAMGWLLVGMAAYFVRPVLPQALSAIPVAAVALAAGVHLGWMERTRASAGAFRWLQAASGLAGVVLATYLLGLLMFRGPGVSWQAYSPAALEAARAQGRPIIVDIYASWCTPCRELDEVTFRDPDVVRAAEELAMFKVDVTHGGQASHEALLERYEIKGVPTVLFLDARGEERRDLRLVDCVAPSDLLVRMSAVARTRP